MKLIAVVVFNCSLLWVLIDGKPRTCPPGTIPYEEDDRCCHPVFECGENESVARCTVNNGNESCKSCHEDETLGFQSSSFDRKKCYTNPCEGNNPDAVGIDNIICVCKWNNDLYHVIPVNPLLRKKLNCQYRSSQCKPGLEPNLTADGCQPCKPGFFKSSKNNSLCRAWKNCTLMGYKVKTAGSSLQDEECDEDIPSGPPGSITPKSVTTSTVTTSASTDFPSSPSTEEKKSNIGLIAGVSVAVLLVIAIIVLFCYMFRVCSRIHEFYKRRQQNNTKPNQNGHVPLQVTTPENEALLVGPVTMETIIDSNSFDSNIGQTSNGTHLTNGAIGQIQQSSPNHQREIAMETTPLENIFTVADENSNSRRDLSHPQANGHPKRNAENTNQSKVDDSPEGLQINGLPKVNQDFDDRSKQEVQTNRQAKANPEILDPSGVKPKVNLEAANIERSSSSEVDEGACADDSTSRHPRVTDRKVDRHLHVSINGSSTSNTGQYGSQNERTTNPFTAHQSHPGTSLEVQPASGGDQGLDSMPEPEMAECRTPPEGAESSHQGPDESFDWSHQTPPKRVNINQHDTQVKSGIVDPDITQVKQGQNPHVDPRGNDVDLRGQDLRPQGRIGDMRGQDWNPKDHNVDSRGGKPGPSKHNHYPRANVADKDNTIVKKGSSSPVNPHTRVVQDTKTDPDHTDMKHSPKARPELDRTDSKEDQSVSIKTPDKSEAVRSDSMNNAELSSVNHLFPDEADEQTVRKLRDSAPTDSPPKSEAEYRRPYNASGTLHGANKTTALEPILSSPILPRVSEERPQVKRTISLPEGPKSGTGGRPVGHVTPQRIHSCDDSSRQPEEHSEPPSLHNGFTADFPNLRDGGSVSGTDSSQQSS